MLTPTTSLAGTVQIVARVLEVALHKAHALGFPLDDVVDGLGTAPLPPPAPDFLTAMGRTNDAILFGGDVQLFVIGPEEAARDLARAAAELRLARLRPALRRAVQAAGYDFYKLDPMLFSPARVTVTALSTGRSFTAGELAPDLLARSFGSAEPASTSMAPDIVVLGPGAGTGSGWRARSSRAASRRSGCRSRPARWPRRGAVGPPAGPARGLPAAVLVRFIPAGSLEQVTLRLGILHALEAAGVLVVNAARRRSSAASTRPPPASASLWPGCRRRRPGRSSAAMRPRPSWSARPRPGMRWC